MLFTFWWYLIPKFWMISSTFYLHNSTDLAMLIHSFITLWLDYCNMPYVGLPLKSTWKIQLIQNVAAWLLSGGSRWEHILPILKPVHWLPVSFWVQFKLLAVTLKLMSSSCYHLAVPHLRFPTWHLSPPGPFILHCSCCCVEWALWRGHHP